MRRGPWVRQLRSRSKRLSVWSWCNDPRWTQVYSTNLLERLNAEIKRRTNVVGIFHTYVGPADRNRTCICRLGGGRSIH
jgi:Transposase, Mutator family